MIEEDDITNNIIEGERIITDMISLDKDGNIIAAGDITMEELMEGLNMIEEINATRSDMVQMAITSLREMLDQQDKAEEESMLASYN